MNYTIEKMPLQFTDAAANRVKELLTKKNSLDLKLRIHITGGGCGGFKYNFTLDNKIIDGDLIIKNQGVSLVIDKISLQYLIGSLIDFSETLEGSRFIVVNPNAKTTCSCGSSFSI